MTKFLLPLAFTLNACEAENSNVDEPQNPAFEEQYRPDGKEMMATVLYCLQRDRDYVARNGDGQEHNAARIFDFTDCVRPAVEACTDIHLNHPDDLCMEMHHGVALWGQLMRAPELGAWEWQDICQDRAEAVYTCGPTLVDDSQAPSVEFPFTYDGACDPYTTTRQLAPIMRHYCETLYDQLGY